MQLQRRVLSTHHHSLRAEFESATATASAAVAVAVPRSLSRLLASRTSEVARAVSEAVAAHLTEYGEITASERSRCLISAMFESMIESAVTGEPYCDRELARFRELGARAAYWKLRLPDLTTAFNVALAAAHREFWSMAPPEDFVEMAEVTARCASMAEQARDACVDGYVAPKSPYPDTRLARRMLAERLIAGDWDADPARLHALAADIAPVPPSYLVLIVESDAPESVWTKLEADVVKVRGALYVKDVSTLTALLPTEGASDALRVADTAANLVDRFADLAADSYTHAKTRTDVHATQAYRPSLADLPAAVDEARRMLPLVKAIPDAQIKPYRANDLLVELALVQQPSIRRRLASLIEPLDAGTGLRHTLEVLLASNLDRERAASELCIHRRTLYYRMDRIRKLSGIDPNTAHGIQLLRSALTSARMQEMESAHATPNPDYDHPEGALR